MIVCLRLPFIACLALIFTLPVHSQSPEKHYLLKAGLLYDSEKSVFLKDQQILIKGNLILKVGPKLDVPPNTEILDYSTATVTPGLVDAHTHILTAQGATEELAVDAVIWETPVSTWMWKSGMPSKTAISPAPGCWSPARSSALWTAS